MRTKFLNQNYLKLQLVSNIKNRSHDWLCSVIRQAAMGGISCFQIRDKFPGQDFIALCHKIKQALAPFKIPIIINDWPEICQKVGANGVHLGQSDMHPNIARKILGPNAIIGLSLDNWQNAIDANTLDSINYVTASPVFPSLTKLGYTEFWGLEKLKELTKFSKHPVTAIGGINHENVSAVMNAGSAGIAVVSSILESSNPEQASQIFINQINQHLGCKHE